MTQSRIARIAAVSVGTAMALSFALQTSAATAADIQAQINALMAQLQSLQGSTAPSAGYAFSANLTVGSRGADVTALQQLLSSKGFLSVAPTGYFGNLTKAAVTAWQASAGLPATGYFGPLSRAKVSGSSATNTTTTYPASTGTTGITTTGVEGTLNVTAGPLSNTVLNVGQSMVPVLTVRSQAQQSDIAIQRITVDLGTNTNLYNKIFSKIYAVDVASGQVLASSPLNGTTVVQSGNVYIITLSGFSDVVKAGTYKDIAIKVDVNTSVDSAYLSGGTSAVTNTFAVDASGVRGTDGAGIDQYGPTGTISSTVTVNKSLVDNAQANLSLAASTPLVNSVAVTDTTNGQLLQLPVLAFNVNAQNDTLHLHQVQVTIQGIPTGNTTATATAAYLYNGSTQVASASIVSPTGVAVFTNITDGTAGASIPANTTVPFTVKVDVTGVTAGSIKLTGTLNTGVTQTIIYNSIDGTITNVGSAAGNAQTVLGKGPVITLVSAPTLVTTGVNSSGTNVSSSTITATFNVNVTAVGSDVTFGTMASTTNPIFTFQLLNSVGTDITGTGATSGGITGTSTPFIVPTGGVFVTSGQGTNSFTLPRGQSGNLTVQLVFPGKDAAGINLPNGLSVQISSFKSTIDGGTTISSQTFMAGLTNWRTNTVNP